MFIFQQRDFLDTENINATLIHDMFNGVVQSYTDKFG